MLRRLALVFFLALPAVAAAQGFSSAFEFSHAQTGFDINGSTYKTHITEAGIQLGHYWYHHLVDVAFRGGYLGVTQDTNPALTGLNLGGYYAGASITSFIPIQKIWGFTLELAGTYHRVSDSVGPEQYRLRWLGVASRAGAWYRLWAARFSAGLYVRNFSGSQLLSGKTNVTSPIAGDTLSGFYAGLSFYTSPHGRVAFFADTGSYQSLMLSFRYGF
jgi:hypothetical protein